MNDEEDLKQEEDEEVKDENSSSNSDIFSEEPKEAQAVLDETAKKLVKKTMIFLLTNPIFWVIIAVFIFLLCLYVNDFDFVGDIYNPDDVEYYQPQCDNIYLVNEKDSYILNVGLNGYKAITNPLEVDISDTDRFEYETLTIDEFVKGIVWQENNLAKDVNNEIVYQALAIAIRTNVIRELNQNCVILRDYNHYNYVELSGQEDKYTEINNAVNSTSGLIISKDNQLINAKYDNFTYEYRSEKNANEEKEYFYYMRNENEQGQQSIPSDWVLANVPAELITKSLTTAKLEYLSLYGAKYLTEKIGAEYSVYRILEYYYGKDIDYFTIEQTQTLALAGGSAGCMWWPIGSDETTVSNGITFAIGNPKTVTITSYFGLRNKPNELASSNHGAIDIGGGVKNVTNIIAVADGVVVETNTGCIEGNKQCGGRQGNYIKIQHSDGTFTKYAHLYELYVKEGDNVYQGQVIAKMGNTGNTTGPHLHFEVSVNGTKVDPLNYVSASASRKECKISTNGNNNQQTICLILKANGFSNNTIAGIMANMQAESGFNPNAINSSSKASGLCQWLGERKKNLQSTYGSNWNVLENQLEFMFAELNSSERTTMAYLRNNAGDTPRNITENFCFYYERPGVNNAEKKTKCHTRADDYADEAIKFLNYAQNGCN